MDIAELAAPLETFGRQRQFQQVTQALADDRDLLIAGVPGSGRRNPGQKGRDGSWGKNY
ncbi:MAG: hypothetical protein RSE13_13485 [Planktothrix sp. GU0601_MAG3]|nr:MAG: hypothetical protein RSE13_13485 [Planktothrix sp. GU0601_MAG3]